MANPVGYQGRGTIIAFNVGGIGVYTALPQLQKFDKTAAKVDFDDATCLDSPGTNKFPIPIVVDNGKWSGTGVFDPQNVNITNLLGFMQAMTQLGFKVTLVDGSTFVGLCYVEQFNTPKVDRYKVNMYDFSINVFGVEVLTPQGGAAINE